MLFNKNHNFKTLLIISFLALSLPLATMLVLKSSDDRSRATEETDKSKINLKIAFKGVKPESTCANSLTSVDLDLVNVTAKAYQSDIGTSITPVAGEVNQSGDQIFLISNIVLDNNFKKTDSYNYFQIKNPAYLSARMCFDRQSSKMTTSAACDITLTNGTTYDFSNYPLIPGDLNQDGIVNSSDFSIVKQSVDPSSSNSCDKEGDLNYDGIVNSFDTSYLKQSLLQTDDEVVVDLSTITPTPTASPITRSITEQKYNTMSYLIYIPNGYTKDKKWPLVIWLHGGGGSESAIALLGSGLPGLISKGYDYDAIIIAPRYSNREYMGKEYRYFIKEDLIPYLIKNYSIDTDRISITGHSTGANRAYSMACKFPNFFSAVVPYSLCNHDWSCSNTLAKSKTPVKLFHGTSDQTCGSWRCVVARNEINDAGGNATCVQLKGKPHEITNYVFIDNKAIEWMIRQVKGQPPQN